jgi:hypothetical protein
MKYSYSEQCLRQQNRSKGNKCAQVFSAKTSSGFIRWNQKLNANQHFEHSQKMSEPGRLITDGAKEETGPLELQRKVWKRAQVNKTEPYTQRQNEAETAIRELRRDGKQNGNQNSSEIVGLWMHTSR